MATREEHLKKINDELEKFSDEELEKVAGGSCYEIADDSRFLNVLLQGTKYHHCDRYGETRIYFDSDAREDVKKAWRSLGIDVDQDGALVASNAYHMNGKKISQAQAWEHAEKLIGRQLTRSQWDW